MRSDQVSSKAVRTAIFIPRLSGGGAERVMVTLANEMARRGWSVDLVLAAAEGPYMKSVSEAVAVVDLGTRRISASIPALVRYLRSRRPGAMISALDHANMAAVVAARMSRVDTRVIITVHANISTAVSQAASRRERIMPYLMRWIYPKADRIVTVSAGLADDLADIIRCPRRRIEVIYNPIDIGYVQRASKENGSHAWLREAEAPLIVSSGRLSPQKDHPTLLAAFVQLRKRRKVRLAILGEGELRNELEKYVEDAGLTADVLMPGFVENPFVWMRRASLFVLSSRWEGFGNVLVEAMACGTPVVSTECPDGPAEILGNGRWGRLVPVGDTAALVEAMELSLDEDERADLIDRAGTFNVDVAVERYLGIAGANAEEAEGSQ